jgi:hypothetical protein
MKACTEGVFQQAGVFYELRLWGVLGSLYAGSRIERAPRSSWNAVTNMWSIEVNTTWSDVG